MAHEQATGITTERGERNVYGPGTGRFPEPLPPLYLFEREAYPTREAAERAAILRSRLNEVPGGLGRPVSGADVLRTNPSPAVIEMLQRQPRGAPGRRSEGTGRGYTGAPSPAVPPPGIIEDFLRYSGILGGAVKDYATQGVEMPRRGESGEMEYRGKRWQDAVTAKPSTREWIGGIGGIASDALGMRGGVGDPWIGRAGQLPGPMGRYPRPFGAGGTQGGRSVGGDLTVGPGGSVRGSISLPGLMEPAQVTSSGIILPPMDRAVPRGFLNHPPTAAQYYRTLDESLQEAWPIIQEFARTAPEGSRFKIISDNSGFRIRAQTDTHNVQTNKALSEMLEYLYGHHPEGWGRDTGQGGYHRPPSSPSSRTQPGALPPGSRTGTREPTWRFDRRGNPRDVDY